MPSFVSEFRCIRCGKKYGPDTYITTCKSCGGVLQAFYAFDKIAECITPAELQRRIPGVWKYSEFLPLVKESSIVTLGEGGTFLHKCDRLAHQLGLRDLYLKDETSNPTGSFIDRGATVEVSEMRAQGRKSAYCGLTGNLAASLVAYAARAGLRCKVVLPQRVDIGKFYQTIAHATDIEIAKDSKEACWRAYRLSTQDDTSHFVMPYNLHFIEGEKTTAYEICEQLSWSLPDKIIVPMGSGGHLSMIWKGIKEFYEIGFLKEKAAEMVGTQSQGCPPIVEALQRGDGQIVPVSKISTIAVDICVEDPPCGSLALQAIRESKGTAVALPDREIVRAVSLLAKLEGIFAEPAAATTIAGLKRLVDEGRVDPSEKVVCLVTGMGLKYPEVTKDIVKGRRKLEELLRQMEKRKYGVALGETKLHILEIISKKESYGYGIWKTLEDLGVKMRIPSVYQHLAELEDANLIIRSKSVQVLKKPERHYYKLTERGRVVLRRLKRLKA